MRIDVEKYLVIGPMSGKDLFFEEVQELGVAEFLAPGSYSKEMSNDVHTYVEALHVLRTMVSVPQTAPIADYRSAIVLARHVVDRFGELEKLREQERILKKESARVQIFGNFSVYEVREIEQATHRKVQFFFAKQSEKLEAPKRPEVIYVGSAYELDYYVAINSETTSYPGMVEIHIDKSVGEIEQELAYVHRTIDEYSSELATLSHQQKLLKQGLIEALNRHHLEESKERAGAYLEGGLFAAEAWVPKNKIAALQRLAEKHHVDIEPIGVETEDRIPTYLENKGPSRLGEDLVSIYDTPSMRDRDPSLWVFIAFGLFFSMIVADAGYGLILLGISLFLFFKFGKKPGFVRRVLFLSIYLSIGCMIWGVFTASFLGIELPLDSPLRKISFLDWMAVKKAEYLIQHKGPAYQELLKQFPALEGETNPKQFLLKGLKTETSGKITYVVHDEFVDNIMLELVIFIGTIHVMLSFIRYLDKNWSGVGWIVFMVGAYLYFPSILKATSLIYFVFGIPAVEGAHIGLYLLFIGMGLAAVLAVIQKKMGGIAELMQVIQIFADVMSYLRIYALSLAGIVMASTFNRIGSSLPLYVGILIILGGHSVNFVLALMGGIIHGLRLNFIEWYHYSFEGGGKPFRPLFLQKIE